METLAELPAIGDQVVCLSHEPGRPQRNAIFSKPKNRVRNPIKRWKLSTMDIESRRHWVDYSQAKDLMFARTDTKECPWFAGLCVSERQGGLVAP